MSGLIRKFMRGFKRHKQKYPFKTQGNVHIIERNGGAVMVHPSALLNSLQEGYHVGMPFETTLIADMPGARIEVGKDCRIHGTYIHAWDKVIIGRGVLIGAGTNIVDSNGHSTNIRYARFRRNFRDKPGRITIGDFVWIGMNCTILKGVDIGECTLISAGSVVKDTVPPFSIVEGNPGKVIHVYDPKDALDESYPLDLLASEDGYYNY